MAYTQNSHTYLENGEKSQSYSESTNSDDNQSGLYSTEQESDLLNQSLFDTEGIQEVGQGLTGEIAIEGESENVGEIPASDTLDQQVLDFANAEWAKFGLDSLDYPDAEASMAAWMGNDSQRENILNPNFEDLGVEPGISADDSAFWNQNFGADIAN